MQTAVEPIQSVVTISTSQCGANSHEKPAKKTSYRRQSAKCRRALEARYEQKFYMLRKVIYFLAYQNTAICDEIARLHQRIKTVTEERKYLLKRVICKEKSRSKQPNQVQSGNGHKGGSDAAKSLQQMSAQ